MFTAKLQAEVRRLQEGLEQQRMHRLESSESILQDARSRIEMLQSSVSISELRLSCLSEVLK
jgi:vacuolar-type H+-ATPase subunit H